MRTEDDHGASRRTEDRIRPVIVWFRDDLRLADNPALAAAATCGAPVICLYILEEGTPRRPLGAASRWWLSGSLASLSANLDAIGGRLVLRRGDPRRIVPAIAAQTDAHRLVFNRRYDRDGRSVDAAVEKALGANGVITSQSAAWLLVEPSAISTKSGTPFRVFTSFWRALQPQIDRLAGLSPKPASLQGYHGDLASDALADWRLTPEAPDWTAKLRARWVPGEARALERLSAFVEHDLARYAGERDFPALDTTSHLSPHLRFGEISVSRLVVAVRLAAERRHLPAATSEKFLSEVGWREFSWHILSHFPDLATRNYQPNFDRFGWHDGSGDRFRAWKRGATGYPIVDAGMRDLWRTGSMPNRVRMIVASFLTKHLGIDWRAGEAWFWDTLVDADLASNPANWQWVAGCGADAAPYFRIFNPVLQGEKFDPDGAYVRANVPEVADLPNTHVHRPWQSDDLFRPSGGYPQPIVDHDAARREALAAFARLTEERWPS